MAAAVAATVPAAAAAAGIVARVGMQMAMGSYLSVIVLSSIRETSGREL